jgi:hypothetical protein
MLRYTYIVCLILNTIMMPGKGKLEMYVSCYILNAQYTYTGYCTIDYVKHLSVFVYLFVYAFNALVSYMT